MWPWTSRDRRVLTREKKDNVVRHVFNEYKCIKTRTENFPDKLPDNNHKLEAIFHYYLPMYETHMTLYLCIWYDLLSIIHFFGYMVWESVVLYQSYIHGVISSWYVNRHIYIYIYTRIDMSSQLCFVLQS